MLLRGPDCSHRIAAAKALGHADGVNAHAGMLERIKSAGPPEAALHLVQHQQQIVLVAELADAPEEFIGARRDPTLALDRLEENRRGLSIDQVGKALQVVQLAKGKARHERPVALLDFFLRRRTHAAEGAAMKRVFRADDLVAFAFLARFPDAVQARELDQALVGFSAAVAKKYPARPG